MSDSHDELSVSLNLLAFLEADEAWIFGREGQQPTCEDVVKFLCRPAGELKLGKIIARYKEITGPHHHKLAILPAERKIFQKITMPMRDAIGSYMVGNFLSTVAICGAVCEMLAIFSFELAMLKAGEKRMTETTQRKLFGDTFEKLGQHRRIDVLEAMNLIDESSAQLFRVPIKIRKDYLHHFSIPHEPLAKDAKRAWNATRELVLRIFKIKVKDGRLVVNSPEISACRRSR